MNYNDAVSALEQGKKVRRSGVPVLHAQVPVIWTEAGSPWHPTKEDMKATDWTLVEEISTNDSDSE